MDEATLAMPAYRPPTWEDQQLPIIAGVRCTQALAGRRDTWRGVTNAGQSVDVTVIALSTEPAVRSAGLAALAGLAGLHVPGMPDVLAVEAARLGVAVIARAVDGQPLGDMARLPARTVAGAGRTLAASLDALHRAGRVLGADVGELGSELRLAADGTTWLCWHGWVQRRLAGALVARSPAGDITTARALLRRFVTTGGDRPSRRLASALEPRARTAGELTRNLARVAGRRARLGPASWRAPALRAHQDTPHRRATGRTARDRARPERPARRGLTRRVATVIAMTLVAVATVAVGWASGRWGLRHVSTAGAAPPVVVPASQSAPTISTDPTDPTGPVRQPTTPTAAKTVGQPSAGTVGPAPSTGLAASCLAAVGPLDAARAAAFAGRGPLTSADLAGSSTYISDAETITELQAAALHSDGPRARLLSTRVVSVSGGLCGLDVGDELPAYHYLDAAGQVVATASARGPRQWRMVLVSTASGWRIASVTQAT